MGGQEHVRAWDPGVPGLREVLHATFTDHAYPMHTHAAWTVLVVDSGAVRYDLDRGEHGAMSRSVTVLPPHVPHNGRSVLPGGFSKRVLYLEPDRFPADLIGRAVDGPTLGDPALRRRIADLHTLLCRRGEEFAAESLLALVQERLEQHLRRLEPPRGPWAAPGRRGAGTATRLRELLDASPRAGLTLAEASTTLGTHPAHLVRAFGRQFGIPPHRYLTGLRLDRARGLLLDGVPAAEVAPLVGFHDQSHLTRHFRTFLHTTPAAYARSGVRGPEPDATFPGSHRVG